MENKVSGVSGPKKCVGQVYLSQKRKLYLSHFGKDDIVDPPSTKVTFGGKEKFLFGLLCTLCRIHSSGQKTLTSRSVRTSLHISSQDYDSQQGHHRGGGGGRDHGRD